MTDINNMEIAEKQIYSNLLYLNLIIAKLTKKEGLLNFIGLGEI